MVIAGFDLAGIEVKSVDGLPISADIVRHPRFFWITNTGAGVIDLVIPQRFPPRSEFRPRLKPGQLFQVQAPL